ncbi:hypothetical protein BKA61DRAFT_100345 [Leptodontidium sp. MPI-SDFR-AT-0119]|nr:hypothetical protein BKA61DRAFT_100345 [Leptodontidium sp. MPI-SDFR-AT-0119]
MTPDFSCKCISLFQCVIMGEKLLVRAATAPDLSRYILTPPPEIYAPNHDSAERALGTPLPAMQPQESEIRKRQHQRISTSAISEFEGESSTGSDTLTPASSAGELPQGSRWLSVQDGWCRLLGNLPKRPSVHTPTQSPREPEHDRGYNRIRPNKLEDHEQGIPRFAAFQNSNDSFCIFRRFGDAATRILEIKQVELWTLITKLQDLDRKDAADDSMRYRLTSIEYHEKWDPTQKDLLETIEEKLTTYYKFLDRYVRIRDLDGVKDRNHKSVYDFNVNNRSFEGGEDAFLFQRDDFISARKTPGSMKSNRVEDMIESYLQNNPESRLHTLFIGKDEQSKSSKGSKVIHLSTFRLSLAPKIAAVCLGTSALFTPIFLLYLGNLSRGEMSCVVGIFVLVFLVTMSVIVDITPHDIFIVIVGYAAVLVTLLSNFGDGSGPVCP